MKTLYFFVAFIFIGILLSCKHDSVPQSGSLAGTWEMVSVKAVSNIPALSFDSTYQHGQSITVTYKTDSTYTSTDSRTLPSATDTGKYYISGGNLYDWPTGEASYSLDGKITFSGNTFTLYQTNSNSGVTVSSTEFFTLL
jgi:hypothetical protein